MELGFLTNCLSKSPSPTTKEKGRGRGPVSFQLGEGTAQRRGNTASLQEAVSRSQRKLESIQSDK